MMRWMISKLTQKLVIKKCTLQWYNTCWCSRRLPGCHMCDRSAVTRVILLCYQRNLIVISFSVTVFVCLVRVVAPFHAVIFWRSGCNTSSRGTWIFTLIIYVSMFSVGGIWWETVESQLRSACEVWADCWVEVCLWGCCCCCCWCR